MLHLVLFLAYSEHNPTNHLKPPQLVEFVRIRQNMYGTWCKAQFILEKLTVKMGNNGRQQPPKLELLLVLEQS